MTEERELLTLAAKALGLGLKWFESEGYAKGGLVLGLRGCVAGCPDKQCTCDPFTYWSSLASDGDCKRMEDALGIDVSWSSLDVRASHEEPYRDPAVCYAEYIDHANDRSKARRWASTRVAASIGAKL